MSLGIHRFWMRALILCLKPSYGKEMKPNGQTPQHHHNCLIDDDDLMGM